MASMHARSTGGVIAKMKDCGLFLVLLQQTVKNLLL